MVKPYKKQAQDRKMEQEKTIQRYWIDELRWTNQTNQMLRSE